MFAEEHNHTWQWVSINFNPIVSATPHLPSTGDIPDSGQLSTFLPTQLGIISQKDTGIPCRVHTSTIFLNVGVALKDVTSLADNLSCFRSFNLALHYMHKAGWVHRNFSVRNTIWVGGVGKWGDFEYTKEIDSNTSNDGTMHFMAVEVESQNYLFFPRHARHLDQLSICMNFLHNIESIWWAFTWILFYHTDTKMVNTDHSFDAHAQLKEYQVAFPGFFGQTSRRDFFLYTG
ncbi:uncharacterized protein EDB91DRAFT_1059502 [Suillus paluster]|uniref:uncharacterized protein n=1 Tax=Suillus paluster TaxID=48578 RepID=UPI001B8768D6|nr:uncharacterized protein EDB91DRAFT_1059502 [Suillus paluster]KAG1730422.1 hypothetical protein EDB91DRAFT_1059502 [Suillus paluster]